MKTIVIALVVVVIAVVILVVLATVPVVAEQTHDTVSCGGFAGLTSRSFPSGTNVNIYWTTGPGGANVTFAIAGGSITAPTVYSHTGSSDSTQLHSTGGTYYFTCVPSGTGTTSPDVAVTENFTAPIL